MTLIYCLNLFFVTKECSKINALLSSVILHAKSLTNPFNKNLEEVLNVCKTSAKNKGEACEKRLYTNNHNLNLIENILLLVTKAVDSRYRFPFLSQK